MEYLTRLPFSRSGIHVALNTREVEALLDHLEVDRAAIARLCVLHLSQQCLGEPAQSLACGAQETLKSAGCGQGLYVIRNGGVVVLVGCTNQLWVECHGVRCDGEVSNEPFRRWLECSGGGASGGGSSRHSEVGEEEFSLVKEAVNGGMKWLLKCVWRGRGLSV
ncbi:hypothetical protein BST61_g10695 [Cercospora zeina]